MFKRYFNNMNPDEVVEEISKLNKNVVTLVGYSNEYFDKNYLINTVFSELDKLTRSEWVVNIGVTPVGIGEAYNTAIEMGFETCGIASKKALEYIDLNNNKVDYIFLVADKTWGGYNDSGKLNPTSIAIVNSTDLMIGVGGGKVSLAELTEARKMGIPVKFFEAYMVDEFGNKSLGDANKFKSI